MGIKFYDSCYKLQEASNMRSMYYSSFSMKSKFKTLRRCFKRRKGKGEEKVVEEEEEEEEIMH